MSIEKRLDNLEKSLMPTQQEIIICISHCDSNEARPTSKESDEAYRVLEERYGSKAIPSITFSKGIATAVVNDEKVELTRYKYKPLNIQGR